MNINRHKKIIFIFLIILIFNIFGIFNVKAKSEGFVPLEKEFFEELGGEKAVEDSSIFFNNLFKFGVYIAGFLATIMIAIGGIIYMSTDAINGKKQGKEMITGALAGLLLVLFSYILLNQINPDLLNLSIFK